MVYSLVEAGSLCKLVPFTARFNLSTLSFGKHNNDYQDVCLYERVSRLVHSNGVEELWRSAKVVSLEERWEEVVDIDSISD